MWLTNTRTGERTWSGGYDEDGNAIPVRIAIPLPPSEKRDWGHFAWDIEPRSKTRSTKYGDRSATYGMINLGGTCREYR